MNDELIDAITITIASKFEYPVYVDKLGEDFKRPSFFVYRISDLDSPLNRWTYNTNTIIQIMYFGEEDDYSNIISKADQVSTITTLKHKFMSDMGVKYVDKWSRLEKTNVDYTGDKDIFLQLTLNTTTGTRQEYDESQNIDIMREFNFKGGVK